MFLIAGQRLILNIWQEKSAGPMHLLHMGYGIGSFIVPLYSNPFLAVPLPTSTENATYEMDIDNPNDTTPLRNNSRLGTETPVGYLKESRIEYTYAISGCMVALLSIVYYFYQIRERRNVLAERKDLSRYGHKLVKDEVTFDEPKLEGIQSRTFREMFNPASCSGGRTWYAVQLLLILFFYFANSNGGERLIAGFVRSFSVDQLGFDSYQASYLNTSFWISFTVGRFLFFVAARWIGIRKLILIETCGVTITALLMNIFSVNNSTAYWVLIQPLGFFESPMWPSMMAWTDYHMELTGVGMTLFLFAGGVGGICHLRLIGYLYEHLGSRTFLYQILGFGILALVLAVILTFVGAQHGSRFKWKTSQETISRVDDTEPIQSSLSEDMLEEKKSDLNSKNV